MTFHRSFQFSLIIFLFMLNWQTQAVADTSPGFKFPPPLADTTTITTVAGQLGSTGYACSAEQTQRYRYRQCGQLSTEAQIIGYDKKFRKVRSEAFD
ncbi:MAG TPA: hypothetical protein ENF37_09510 [Beggiatoa sp.]|nr:hypothetical protein [Beggiatoa sp.]